MRTPRSAARSKACTTKLPELSARNMYDWTSMDRCEASIISSRAVRPSIPVEIKRNPEPLPRSLVSASNALPKPVSGQKSRWVGAGFGGGGGRGQGATSGREPQDHRHEQ